MNRVDPEAHRAFLNRYVGSFVASDGSVGKGGFAEAVKEWRRRRDNGEPKPGFTDIVARAKWDAWKKLAGTSSDDAMQQYIDLVTQLRQA